ncbi:MAG: ABC transporter permease, partial [Pseudomonadota bacterium]
MQAELVTKDGVPLHISLKRALVRSKLRTLLFIAPLLLFMVITYVIPITSMLQRSIDNSIVYEVIPQSAELLLAWDGTSGVLPSEMFFETFAKETQIASKARTLGSLGVRYNYDIQGISSKFRKLGREVRKWNLATDGPFRERFAALDPFWGKAENWAIIKVYSERWTTGNFARAIDGQLTTEGFERRPDRERYLVKIFIRTMLLSLLITSTTFILGYPVAWLLSNVKIRTANLLMILVLLPFWTSLLVRTASWRVLLQDSGVINSFLQWVNLHVPFLFAGAPYDIMYNQFAVVVAMTHILLPFMILPLFSVMRTIDPSYVRAAKSLGATNWTTFWRVYFPQSVPGIGAG